MPQAAAPTAGGMACKRTRWVALSINANGWSANTAKAVESVIRDIHQDSRGAERVGVVFVQETKHTGEATSKRAGRLGSRLHSLQGSTVLAHKARTLAVTAGGWRGGGGGAICVHHLLRQRVQLVQTNRTPPFEATLTALTVRARTGPTHWQFVTNTYFEHIAALESISIDSLCWMIISAYARAS
jgi:hypothetical protein